MEDHPTAAELHAFVFGGLSAARSRAVVAHLLRGCETCRGELAPYRPALFGRPEHSEVPLLPPEAYGEAVDRAFAAVRARLLHRSAEEKKREATALLAARGLEGLADAPPDVLGLPLFEALLERSWVLRYENPDQMVGLARWAALLADRLKEGEHGAREVAHVRCRAWVELANAYRVADDLDRADEALERAMSQFRLAGQDEILGARFFDVLASQYAARRFFSMACSTLGVVAEIYRRQGDEHLMGRALIMRGIFAGYQGKAEEAVHLIRQGLSSIDESRDPGLAFSAVQAEVRFQMDCGRFREARRALWELRRRRPDAGGRLNELKVRWLEAQISAGLEELDRAELALRLVKEGYEEAGLPFKAALAGFELGAVLLRRGRFAEATEVVLECAGVFLSLKIVRELLGTILILESACRKGKLTLGLLGDVIARMRELERDPAGRLQSAIER